MGTSWIRLLFTSILVVVLVFKFSIVLTISSGMMPKLFVEKKWLEERTITNQWARL